MEVVLHGAWLASISGSPIYTACRHCCTKIDPETRACKNRATGCVSEPREEVTILDSVVLADFTGQVEQVLVDEEAPLALSGFQEKKSMVRVIKERGSHRLCFRGRHDVGLATAPHLTQWHSTSKLSQSVSQMKQRSSQLSDQVLNCQFQAVAVKSCYASGYTDEVRPMVRKVVRVQNQRCEGRVLRIEDPLTDLKFSNMGILFAKSEVFVDYICVTAYAQDEPNVMEVGEGESKQVLMRHEKVRAVEPGHDCARLRCSGPL